MSINEEVEMLRKIQLFAKVEPAKLKLLAFTSERAVFEPDEVLFQAPKRGALPPARPRLEDASGAPAAKGRGARPFAGPAGTMPGLGANPGNGAR